MVVKKATKPTTATKSVTKPGKVSPPDTEGVTMKGTGDGATFQVINRRLLKNASYNPRIIDPVSQKRLRKSIEHTKGLVQPPIWNKRTGNIVGGHQRIDQLDQIKQTDNYTLTVAVVDWSEEREIEVNIALNNPSLAGQYDLGLLDELLDRPGVDLAAAGFDITTLEMMHIDMGMDLPDFMVPEEERASQTEVDELVEELEELAEEGESDQEDLEEEERIAEMKKRKQEFAKSQEFLRYQNGAVKVMFPTRGTVNLFLEKLSKEEGAEFIDGMELVKLLEWEDEFLDMIESEKPEKLKKQEAKAKTKPPAKPAKKRTPR